MTRRSLNSGVSRTSDTPEPTQSKVFIIVDRHPVHRSKKVKSGIDENHICLFFLPGYSPE
ncbi:hypothetical protein C5S30_03285 [ANME-1 cluster archaeon GoMg4]|nr:hypothetical protein [ANME-1 cluster archaeon GoMg4]